MLFRVVKGHTMGHMTCFVTAKFRYGCVLGSPRKKECTGRAAEPGRWMFVRFFYACYDDAPVDAFGSLTAIPVDASRPNTSICDKFGQILRVAHAQRSDSNSPSIPALRMQSKSRCTTSAENACESVSGRGVQLV